MASMMLTLLLPLFLLATASLLTTTTIASRHLTTSSSTTTTTSPNYQLIQYHKGPLLSGKISINLIWYGKFSATQRSIVSDFITSLSQTHTQQKHDQQQNPTVAAWWSTIEKYYHLAKQNHKTSHLSLHLGTQILDPNYSLTKSLTSKQIQQIASKGPHSNAINVVLTSSDVIVDGLCTSRCGTHGTTKTSPLIPSPNTKKSPTFAYIWVANTETQCPGQCAWPFHQPMYGPQTPALGSPNNDVGIDGVIINLASLLAGTVTNPFGNGYFQGEKDAPLEASSACVGMYGSGSYPGYAGQVLEEKSSGASYNAIGINGRKYLLPAVFDPSTSRCSTLV